MNFILPGVVDYSQIASLGGRLGAITNMRNGTAIFGFTPEQKAHNSRKAAIVNMRNRTSIFAPGVAGKGLATQRKNGTGIFAWTPEQRSENGRINGKIYGKIGGKISGANRLKDGTGIFSPENQSRMGENCAKGGRVTARVGTGIFAFTPEQRSAVSRRGGRTNVINKTGICGMSHEQCVQTGLQAEALVEKSPDPVT